MSVETKVYLLALLALAVQVWSSEIIPETFPIRDQSRYTIRYLSENGNDTESCLSGHIYPPDANTVPYCKTLVYALSGGHHFMSSNKSNIIVLILPGTYPMGDRGIEICRYQNIILSRMPATSGEVVVKCSGYLEDDYNNLFVEESVNFALDGIVFTECGSFSTPVRLERSSNAVISNCTFRYYNIIGKQILNS